MEAATDVMRRLPQVRVAALALEKDRFYGYKLMSPYKALEEITLNGPWAEFGVYRGRCARFMSAFLVGDRTFHLFDSFEGLPDDWVGAWKKGQFALKESEIPAFQPPGSTSIRAASAAPCHAGAFYNLFMANAKDAPHLFTTSTATKSK